SPAVSSSHLADSFVCAPDRTGRSSRAMSIETIQKRIGTLPDCFTDCTPPNNFEGKGPVQKMEKASASPRRPFPFISMFIGLEDQLNGQLHVELLAGAKTGGAVEVADGVGDLAEARSQGAAVQGEIFGAGVKVRREGTASRDGPDARSQIDAVEEVEHVGAKLDREPLGYGDVLVHG